MNRRELFHENVRALFASFAGQAIESAVCIEMALFGDETAPVFEHPDLPFVQATALELVLSGAGRIHVITWMDDDADYGLMADAAPQELLRESRLLSISLPHGELPIYRLRSLPELQGQRIESVHFEVDDRLVISAVRLEVAESNIHLVAAEVYEGRDGTISIKGHDESVLIFLSDDARAKVSLS